MNRGKPRGAIDGLVRYQRQSRDNARTALTKALIEILAESESNFVTVTAVCRRAGLSSTVAIKKYWNQDLIEKINTHNDQIKTRPIALVNSSVFDANTSTRRLKNTLKKLRIELSLRIAELAALENENTMLKSKIKRLQSL